jgi:undecaprenyl-diphosphatase
MKRFEKKIVLALNRSRVKWLDFVSAFISNITALVLFWALTLWLIALNNRTKSLRIATGLCVVFIIHLIFSELMLKRGARKFSMARQRPYKEYPEEIHPIGRKFSDSSFPSSHLASMVGGFVVMVSFYHFLFSWTILATVLLGWSRVRNGMHYPTDILAGIFLGLIYGYAALEIMSLLHL